MKNWFLAIALIGLNSPAMAENAAPIATCQKIALYGPGGFTASDIDSIVVSAKEDSPSGFEAKIAVKGKTFQIDDIEVGPSKIQEFQEITPLLLPEVRWSEVNSARILSIGAKANREDGNGASIIQLFAKEQKLLGQMVTLGWSFGRCQ